MPQGLTVLNEDILIRIAYDCTPKDVLALERTCKTLRYLFSEPIRPLWLYFLNQLDNSHAPDLPPHLSIDTLSSAELKRLVSRAVKGRANWNSKTGPYVARRRIIDLKNKGGLMGDLSQSPGRDLENVKIVPGGKYVCTLWSEGYLQCWNAEKNEVLWTYPQLGTFAEIKVYAFDVQVDVSSGQLYFVLVGGHPDNIDGACFMELFWLKPDSRRATRIKGRTFGWEVPKFLKICGDAIIMGTSNSYTIIDRTSENSASWEVDIVRETIVVLDDYFIFVGKENRSEEYTLFAVDVQRVLSLYRNLRASITRSAISDSSKRTELNNIVLRVPISALPEHLGSIHLSTCRPTWRNTSGTAIYVIGNLGARPGAPRLLSTRFSLYSFELSGRSGNGAFSALPPSLTLRRSRTDVSIPLSHPFCTEHVYALSHAGRGVLASMNTLHNGVRYYAFSMEKLFNEDEEKSTRPILLGRDYVVPGRVYMEKYSGALAFVSKGQLIMQYYD